MKVVDRVFCCLLILGGVGHSLGSFKAYGAKPDELLWSLCGSLFIFLLGIVNLVRAGRDGDRALGWITLVFNLCWLAAVIQFGRVIGNMADPRLIFFLIVMLVVLAMSVRSIRAEHKAA